MLARMLAVQCCIMYTHIALIRCHRYIACMANPVIRLACDVFQMGGELYVNDFFVPTKK